MPKLESVMAQATRDPRMITTVGEYQGESTTAVAATQLGAEFTRTQATRIVQEWVDLDYSPLLRLPRLKAVRVMATRGMKPSHEELRERLPWAE